MPDASVRISVQCFNHHLPILRLSPLSHVLSTTSRHSPITSTMANPASSDGAVVPLKITIQSYGRTFRRGDTTSHNMDDRRVIIEIAPQPVPRTSLLSGPAMTEYIKTLAIGIDHDVRHTHKWCCSYCSKCPFAPTFYLLVVPSLVDRRIPLDRLATETVMAVASYADREPPRIFMFVCRSTAPIVQSAVTDPQVLGRPPVRRVGYESVSQAAESSAR